MFFRFIIVIYTLRHTGRYSQEPVNRNDESDVIRRQSNRGQYNHHGDQACLWDACSSDTGCSRCDTWRHTHTHTTEIFSFKHLSCFSFYFLRFYLMVMIWPKFISILLTWAMKMAASASYRAVPSMLMVAPTGSTKRVIRLSILLFSSRHLKVTGRVAELGRKRVTWFIKQFDRTVEHLRRNCWEVEFINHLP